MSECRYLTDASYGACPTAVAKGSCPSGLGTNAPPPPPPLPQLRNGPSMPLCDRWDPSREGGDSSLVWRSQPERQDTNKGDSNDDDLIVSDQGWRFAVAPSRNASRAMSIRQEAEMMERPINEWLHDARRTVIACETRSRAARPSAARSSHRGTSRGRGRRGGCASDRRQSRAAVDATDVAAATATAPKRKRKTNTDLESDREGSSADLAMPVSAESAAGPAATAAEPARTGLEKGSEEGQHLASRVPSGTPRPRLASPARRPKPRRTATKERRQARPTEAPAPAAATTATATATGSLKTGHAGSGDDVSLASAEGSFGGAQYGAYSYEHFDELFAGGHV